jgi:hypothetical protein
MAHAILKLVSGETIIADVSSSTKQDYLTVKDPLIVRSGVDDDSRLVMSMYKWIESAQTTFSIEKSHVILRAAPSEYLIDYYNEAKEDALIYDEEDVTIEQFEQGHSNLVH